MEVFVIAGIVEGEPRPNIIVVKDYKKAMECADFMKKSGYYTHVYFRKEEVI